MFLFIIGVKKFIYIYKFFEFGGNKQFGKVNSLVDLGIDLLVFVEIDKLNFVLVSFKFVIFKFVFLFIQDV